MDLINEWITNIILFILLAIIIDLLLPNSSMQKYVKMVVGLLLIVIILTPLFRIFSTDVETLLQSINLKSSNGQDQNLENLIEMKKNEIQASQHAYILEQMAVQMKSDVNEELVQKYGLNVKHISLNIPDEKITEDVLKGDISSIEVVLSEEVEKTETVTKVETVSIDTSKPIQKDENQVEAEVVKFLASKWEIDPEKVVVVMEGGNSGANER